MKEQNSKHTENPNQPAAPPIEKDYEAHQADPGPAPTVNEPENDGAGPAMKWIIPIAIVVLLIVYFVFFRNNVSQ